MSMKEIAQRTNSSVATVSRVLNCPNHRSAKREEILQAARDLNYAPNASARKLRLGTTEAASTKFLGILITRADSVGVDPFFTEITRSLEAAIHRQSAVLTKVVYSTAFSDEATCTPQSVQALVDEMATPDGRAIDGLIILGKCAPLALQQLLLHTPNIVSLNRNSTNYLVDEVHCDGEEIARLACEHLLELGHTQLAYVGATKNEARFTGFKKTLAARGLALADENIHDVVLSEAEGFAVMQKILENPTSTGIYVANDIIAVGMLKCLWEQRNRGIQPSIIASDDIEEAQHTKPMLTTIHLPKEEMAGFALRLLLDRMNGGHSAVVKLQVQGALKARCSTFRV